MATLALFVALLSIGLILALSFVLSHASRMKQIEKTMGSLQSRVALLETRIREMLELSGPAKTSGQVSTEPVIAGTVGQRIPSEEGRPAPAGVAEPPYLSRPLPPATVKAPPPPEKPSRTKGEWEALIGGKLLNRIGALALIIGIGLFLKYAFDNNWLTEWMRVSIGVLIGVVCLAGAARAVRKGFEVFAQGLVGAGLAILYLSVYASFNFYSLVSQPVAFVAMSAVTVVAYIQAFRYNALAVALLGLLGGFLTPFMLSTGEVNMPGLFTYVALLDLGLLMVAARKAAWIVLEPLAMLGTYCIYILWYSTSFQEEKLIPVLLFLTLFWILFHGFDLYRIRRGVNTLGELHRVISIVHSIVVFGALNALFSSRPDSEQALATLVLGIVYVSSALFTGGNNVERKSAFGQFMVTGIVFSFLAVPTGFDGFKQMVFWSLGCIGTVWVGLIGRHKAIWGTGLILLALSFPMLLGIDNALAFQPLEAFRLLLNERGVTFAIVIVALGMGGHLYRTGAPTPSTKVHETFQYAWFLLLIIGLNVETNDLFRLWMMKASSADREILPFQRLMTIAGVNGLAGFVTVGYGLGARMRPLFFGSLWLLLCAAGLAAIRGLWFSPIEAFVPLLNIRAVVMLVLVFGFFGVRTILAKSAGVFDWEDEFLAIASYVPIILLLVLFSAEGWDFFEREKALLTVSLSGDLAEESARIHNLQHLTLSSVWLVFSILLMLFGLLRRERGHRFLAIGLFGIAILKIFIYDLSFLDTLYRIFSFVGLGLILLAVSYMYQRYREVILGSSPPPAES